MKKEITISPEQQIQYFITDKLETSDIIPNENFINYFTKNNNISKLERNLFNCYCAQYFYPYNPILDAYVNAEVSIEYDDILNVCMDLELPFGIDANLQLNTYIEILEAVIKYHMNNEEISDSRNSAIKFKGGKRHGKFETVNKQGLKYVKEYNEGKPVGIWQTYYPSGQISMENNFNKQGGMKYLQTKWHENGSVKQEWSIFNKSGDFTISVYDKESRILFQSFYNENCLIYKTVNNYYTNQQFCGDKSITEYESDLSYTKKYFEGKTLLKTYEINRSNKSTKLIVYDGNKRSITETIRVNGKTENKFYTEEK